jgi:hypothetical protein
MVIGHKRRDGTFVPDGPLPEPCPACGQISGKLLVIVKELVGSDGIVIPYDD